MVNSRSVTASVIQRVIENCQRLKWVGTDRKQTAQRKNHEWVDFQLIVRNNDKQSSVGIQFDVLPSFVFSSITICFGLDWMGLNKPAKNPFLRARFFDSTASVKISSNSSSSSSEVNSSDSYMT